MKRLAILALLLPMPAMAQDAPVESVDAYGTSLVGVWRVGSPNSVSTSGFFSPLQWGPERRHFCRIAPRDTDLEMTCSGGPERWTVATDGNHVHFAWGTMLLRFVLDGELQDRGHFRGRYQIKISGITSESPASYEAARVMPDPDDPGPIGRAQTLRRILEQGLADVPHDGANWKDGLREPPKLGAVSAIAYLGAEDRERPARERGGKSIVYAVNVYQVRFAQGERLCGLHQRDDGIVDDFRCV